MPNITPIAFFMVIDSIDNKAENNNTMMGLNEAISDIVTGEMRRKAKVKAVCATATPMKPATPIIKISRGVVFSLGIKKLIIQNIIRLQVALVMVKPKGVIQDAAKISLEMLMFRPKIMLAEIAAKWPL